MQGNYEKWTRARSTHVYLHPPLANRLVLLGPEFKITNCELLDNGIHVGQNGIGMLLLHGEEMDAFNFKETEFSPVEAGYPIYTVNNKAEDCDVSMEVFCNSDRNPTLFFRVTLKNPLPKGISGTIGVLCRSGKEDYMAQDHQEGYVPYDPHHKNWYMLKRTWKQTDTYRAEDEKGAILLQVPENLSVRFVADGKRGHTFEAADYFNIAYGLKPDEEVSFEGCFGAKDENADKPLVLSAFDYEAEKAKNKAFWDETLSDIHTVPDSDIPLHQNIFRHMATQMMQMLANYGDSHTPAPRQGGYGRFIWPYESAILLTNLDRIGLSRYTGDAYRYFCERWLVREGEDKGRMLSGCGTWENFTGAVIWGISEHLIYNHDEEKLNYFLPDLMLMLNHIEEKRHRKSDGYSGIFPSGKGSDWADIAQFWTFTDSYNVMAIRRMAAMLKEYGREEAKYTSDIAEDYFNRLIEIRDEVYAGHENDEMYIFPHELGIPFEDTMNYSYYVDGAPTFLWTGVIEPGSKMHRQMENYFRNHGQFERGLTGLMTSCDTMWDGAYHGGYGDVWYTMQSEALWIPSWMAIGETEKAKESLEAMMTYGMTKEMIVSERYCSINPWYSPWQPNASGSARMVQMLLCVYGERKVK